MTSYGRLRSMEDDLELKTTHDDLKIFNVKYPMIGSYIKVLRKLS